MSRASNRTDGDVVREFLSVADLLAEPRLARLYAFFERTGPATVSDAMDALDLSQGTAYSYVDRLVDAGALDVIEDGQPRTYAAQKIDLTVTAADGDREFEITPALIDAVGRRETDDDLDLYVDRHGVAGLATALDYAVARARGEVTHRQMARELDVSPLAAELVLQALEPVVDAHVEVPEAGASVDAIDPGEPPSDDEP